MSQSAILAQIRFFSYIRRVEPLMGRDRAWGILEDLVREKRTNGWPLQG